LEFDSYSGSFCASDFGVVCASDFGSNCALVMTRGIIEEANRYTPASLNPSLPFCHHKTETFPGGHVSLQTPRDSLFADTLGPSTHYLPAGDSWCQGGCIGQNTGVCMGK